MADGRLVQHHGEAIVLRTWPFHEADLLVSLFTRDQGKVKGVARHAMRSRRRFGGALEPGTHVVARYAERPGQELVRFDAFEIVWSPLTGPVDALRLAGLQLVVEVLEEAMPEGAQDDNVFRLAVAVLRAMESPGTRAQVPANGRGGVWVAVTYFCLWMNRLMGWWPEMGHCVACGLDMRPSAGESGEVWWSPGADGVTCADDRRAGSMAVSAESVAESFRLQRLGLGELMAEAWGKGREIRLAAGLGAMAVGVLERHLERRLRSATALI